MPDLGKLVVQQVGQEAQEVALQETTTFGRAPDNDVVLSDALVSRHHAKLVYQAGRYVLSDLNSHNGTWVGGQRISEQEITPGTPFTIGPATITLQTAAAYVPPAPPPPFRATVSFEFAPTAPAAQVKRVRLDRPVLTLGRDPSCDVVLDHPTVSRLHAQIRKMDGNFVLFDLKSTNGTFVNGQRVEVQHQLQVGDEIRIASYKIVFDGVAIAPQDEAGNIRLDAIGMRKVVGKGVVLLNKISLSIAPREFVAIVGVSGAGKTTLLDALSGFRPATAGAVLANGVNLYQNFDAYRTQLGYVPQEDIIHKELTVYEALDYAAQLRMPADATSSERHQRITEVLGNLDMVAAKDRPIHRLSGGERKRVSIGVELLTRPSLFYLDEATSGLDPGTEAQLMQLLARLADQGRTVMLVTHATKNVMLCDQVVFLAKGGNLAYFGPPTGALNYFGVQDFDQIYTKLEHEKSPQEWAKRYQSSQSCRNYVEKRLKEGPGVTAQAPSATVVKQAPGSTVKRVSALKQLIILSRRSLNILVRDRASLALMILIAPLIGMMDFIMRESNPFATSGGSASQGMIMLFLMALICILVGAVASMREIVKEADIYRRERMVTLKIIPYVISKLWLGVLLAAYQSVVFILTKRLSAGWPDTRETIVLTFVTLFLATLSGILLGLLISAVSPNQNVAPLLLIMVLVPQFMFAGALMPLSTFGPAGKFIGYATSTKWGFESLVTISKLGKDVAEDPCWQLPKDKRDALLEKDKAKCTCMGSNLFKKCSFPSLADLYDPAVDTPEPVQPKALGNLPSQPPTCPAPPASQSAEAQSKYQQEMQDYQKAMEAYGKDMEAYKESVNKYQNDMDTWRVRYQDWKAKHDRAIAEGEGLIKKIYEDFGFMFKVNLATHWGWLGGITVVVFALVLLVQKRKDVV